MTVHQIRISKTTAPFPLLNFGPNSAYRAGAVAINDVLRAACRGYARHLRLELPHDGSRAAGFTHRARGQAWTVPVIRIEPASLKIGQAKKWICRRLRTARPTTKKGR